MMSRGPYRINVSTQSNFTIEIYSPNQMEILKRKWLALSSATTTTNYHKRTKRNKTSIRFYQEKFTEFTGMNLVLTPYKTSGLTCTLVCHPKKIRASNLVGKEIFQRNTRSIALTNLSEKRSLTGQRQDFKVQRLKGQVIRSSGHLSFKGLIIASRMGTSQK